MPEVTLVIVLTNKTKEGWDLWGNLPDYYKPGRPLVRYVPQRPNVRELVLGEKNFDDKLLIYREAMSAYAGSRDYMRLIDLPRHAEFLCKPFSEGDHRGVVVVVLESIRLFRKNLTKLTLLLDLYDVDVDEAPQQISSKPKALEAETLPKVPEDTGADIREATFQPSIPTRDEAHETFRRFARANPKEGVELAYELVRETEEALPPEHRRTLGLREAARRISDRGIRIDHTQLGRFFAQGRISIGALGPDGELRFSPAECDSFVSPPRLKPGPKAADIREATIERPVSESLTPEEREARLEAEFNSFIGDHLERGGPLVIRLWKKAEEALPPEQRHSLGLREAARRISEARGISLDHSQLRNYFDEGLIGILDPYEEPRFSPAECDVFVPPPPRKRGPKPKNSHLTP